MGEGNSGEFGFKVARANTTPDPMTRELEFDPVEWPKHYARLNPQPIDVIELWELPFHEAQVLKYIARAGHKDPSKLLEDLQKAAFYLNRKIMRLKRER
jgi:hypothetical protein